MRHRKKEDKWNIKFLIPVADDARVSQQLKDAQKLESQQVSPLAPLFVLRIKHSASSNLTV